MSDDIDTEIRRAATAAARQAGRLKLTAEQERVARQFRGALPIVASSLGRTLGVRVAIGGEQAFAVPGHVQIPVLPLEWNRAQTYVRLYLDHEAGGHLRHTDYRQWVQRQCAPILNDLNGILEDVRVEQAVGRELPGCSLNLRKGIAAMVEDREIGQVDVSTNPDPYHWFFVWLLAHTRNTYLGQAALGPSEDLAARLLRPLVGTLLDVVVKACRRIPDLKTTQDALDLASELFEILKTHKPKKIPKPVRTSRANGRKKAPQESSTENETDDDQGPGASAPSSEWDHEEADSSKPSDESLGENQDATAGDDGSSATASSDPDADEAAGEGGGDDTRNTTAREASTGALGPNPSSETDSQEGHTVTVPSPHNGEEEAPEGESTASPAVAGEGISTILEGPKDDENASQYDLGRALREKLEEVAGDANAHEGFVLPGEDVPKVIYPTRELRLDEVRRATNALRVRLTGLVQAQKLVYSPPRVTGRRLSTGHLCRVGVGDPRLFRAKQRREDVNTAVVILLDRSDSMSWEKQQKIPIEIASEAVLAAMDALRSIPGVASAAAAFPGVLSPFSSPRHASGDSTDPDRVAVLTGFSESLRRTVSERRYQISADGGTPLHAAVWWGVWKLLSRPEDRKILLVATDGQPNDPEAARRVLERAEQTGIQTLGLGILHPQVASVFPTHRVIDELTDLPKALFAMLEDVLLPPLRRQAA